MEDTIQVSQNIGNNIKKWREFRGIKQEDLAKKLNITPPALSKIENNIADVQISRLIKIAEILDIRVEHLFTDPQTTFNFNQCSQQNGVVNGNINNQMHEEIIKELRNQLNIKDDQIKQLLQKIVPLHQ